MDLKAFRQKDEATIAGDLKNEQRNLLLIRRRVALSQEKNSSLIRKSRSAIARLKTVIKEKEILKSL